MSEKPKNYEGWQSDVIVDLIKRYAVSYTHLTLPTILRV